MVLELTPQGCVTYLNLLHQRIFCDDFAKVPILWVTPLPCISASLLRLHCSWDLSRLDSREILSTLHFASPCCWISQRPLYRFCIGTRKMVSYPKHRYCLLVLACSRTSSATPRIRPQHVQMHTLQPYFLRDILTSRHPLRILLQLSIHFLIHLRPPSQFL